MCSSDLFLHGFDVAKAAANEIQRFYDSGQATQAHRQFFDQALNNYSKITAAKPGIEYMFANHIKEIESTYHPDKAGKFVELWPELAHLCQ